MRTVLLLLVSNIFMTFAWYGHLRFKEVPLWKAIIVSWLIALVEYCFQVPANRWAPPALLCCAAEDHAGGNNAVRLRRVLAPISPRGVQVELRRVVRPHLGRSVLCIQAGLICSDILAGNLREHHLTTCGLASGVATSIGNLESTFNTIHG